MSEPQYIYVKEKPKTGCLTQVIAGFLGLLLIALIIGGFSSSLENTKNVSVPTPDSPAVVYSQLHGQTLEYGGMEITGILKNKCSVELNGVSIRFSVFDSGENKIGDAIDYISSLDAGGTWKFKATASQSGSFRLDGVSCTTCRLLVEQDPDEIQAKKDKDKYTAQIAIEQTQRAAADETARREREVAQIQENIRKTFKFYSQSASNGDGYAQLKLAQLYMSGERTEADEQKAYFWFSCAATNGHPEGMQLWLKRKPTAAIQQTSPVSSQPSVPGVVTHSEIVTEEYARRINAFADKWDMTVEEVMRWDYVFSKSGLTLGDFDQSLAKLNQSRDKALGYHVEIPKRKLNSRRLVGGETKFPQNPMLTEAEENVVKVLKAAGY
jgi:hypothetical protein